MRLSRSSLDVGLSVEVNDQGQRLVGVVVRVEDGRYTVDFAGAEEREFDLATLRAVGATKSGIAI